MGKKASPPTIEVEKQPDDTERKVVRIVGFGLPVGTVLAGLGVVAIMWASVRTLSGDAPITLEEAIALAAPSAAEEQKRAVLQALKDLEYERSVGKVSDADYEVLLQRYREEA